MCVCVCVCVGGGGGGVQCACAHPCTVLGWSEYLGISGYSDGGEGGLLYIDEGREVGRERERDE